MFSRSQRLTSVFFDEVLKGGRSFRSQNFSLLVVRDLSLSPKIGVVVSKKNIRKAVKRNRLRRQVRSWIRAYVKSNPIVMTTGIIIFVNTNWLGPIPTTYKTELENLLLKAKVV